MFKDYKVKYILFSVVCGVWYFIGKSVQKLQGTDYMMFSVDCCVWCLYWFMVNTVQRLLGDTAEPPWPTASWKRPLFQNTKLL